jgi:hypothetical protein
MRRPHFGRSGRRLGLGPGHATPLAAALHLVGDTGAVVVRGPGRFRNDRISSRVPLRASRNRSRMPLIWARVSGGRAAATVSIRTRALTRSGARRAARSDRKPPWEWPTRVACSPPRWSSRPSRLTGLGSPASVRAIFHRRLGTSPHEYRTMFRHRSMPPCGASSGSSCCGVGAWAGWRRRSASAAIASCRCCRMDSPRRCCRL